MPSRNLYWLSARGEILDEDHTTWFYTPVSQFADLTDGAEVLPARWDDNYVSLAVGAKHTLRARYGTADRRGASPARRVEGHNLAARIESVSVGAR